MKKRNGLVSMSVNSAGQHLQELDPSPEWKMLGPDRSHLPGPWRSPGLPTAQYICCAVVIISKEWGYRGLYHQQGESL